VQSIAAPGGCHFANRLSSCLVLATLCVNSSHADPFGDYTWLRLVYSLHLGAGLLKGSTWCVDICLKLAT